MAERRGFEPRERVAPLNGFRDRPDQPLWHLSANIVTNFLSTRYDVNNSLKWKKYRQSSTKKLMIFIKFYNHNGQNINSALF
jgi:hypothetical protein